MEDKDPGMNMGDKNSGMNMEDKNSGMNMEDKNSGMNNEKQLRFGSYVSFFKSIVDQDRCSIVICNLKHEIIYMNPAAIKNYAKSGGDKLIGQSIMACHNPESREKMQQVIDWFSESAEHNIVYTFYNEKQNKDVYMVALREGEKLIGYYEKHEFRNKETSKAYDLW